MRSKRTPVLIVFLILLSIVIYARKGGFDSAAPSGTGLFGATETAYVKRVIDGDTIELAGGRRLRYVGIDTPEMDHPNKKIREMAAFAKKANEQLVGGKRLRLEYDVEKIDRYGRLLAYVFLEDGTLVNAKLVQEGYALILTIPPNVRYADMFLNLQRGARKAKKGFWSDEEADFENMRKGIR